MLRMKIQGHFAKVQKEEKEKEEKEEKKSQMKKRSGFARSA